MERVDEPDLEKRDAELLERIARIRAAGRSAAQHAGNAAALLRLAALERDRTRRP